MPRLQRREFKGQGDLTITLMPNDEGGLQNAYLGIYDAEGHYIGGLDGEALARFAKATQPYSEATVEKGIMDARR